MRAAAFNPTTFTWRPRADPPVDNAANATSRAAYVDGTLVLLSTLEDGAEAHNQLAPLDLESGT